MSEEVTEETYLHLKKVTTEFSSLIEQASGTHLILTKTTIDGLCSASILFSLLQKKENGLQVSFQKSIGEKRLDEIKEKKYDNIWMINFPITEKQLKELNKWQKKIFIINYKLGKDLVSFTEKENNVQILSTATLEIERNFLSSSGILYFVAKACEKDYYKFGIPALLGALAEKQVEQVKQTFIGFNKFILNELLDANIISLIHGTRIRGRETKPIHLALMYSIDPYFPRLTGNEQACTSFLSKIGIIMKDQENEWRKISELTKEEMRKLNDALISLIVSKGQNGNNDVNKLIGPIYVIKGEKEETYTRNLDEYILLIEGAINLELYGLAFSVLLGNRSYQYSQIVHEIDNYYGKSTQIISELESDKVQFEEREYFVIVKGLSPLSNYAILKKICNSGKFDSSKHLFFLFPHRKYSDIFIYESFVNKKKGYLVYPIFSKVKEKGLIEDLSEMDDFFQVKLLSENLQTVLTEVEKLLTYHYKGEEGSEQVLTEKNKE